LKLGVHHIDRDNLRRIGILNPRSAILRGLKVVVDSSIIQPKGVKGLIYQFHCTAISEYNDLVGDEVDYGTLLKEEWTIVRSFRDVTLLDRHLKTQIASADSLAVSGSRSIVGAATGLASGLASAGLANVASGLATAAFGHAVGRKRRGQLIPPLAYSGPIPIGGVTRKEEKRLILQSYFNSILKSSNLLSRCPELLRFLGAYDPLPALIKLGQQSASEFKDCLGRFDIRRNILDVKKNNKDAISGLTKDKSIITQPTDKSLGDVDHIHRTEERSRTQLNSSELALLAYAKAQLDRVQFSHVRKGIFDLIQYIFDLDNASTFRSHVFSAIRTVSFAITSANEFNRTIEEMFLKFLNAASVADQIKSVREMMWPNGVLYDSAPPMTTDEQDQLQEKSRYLLQKYFPEQLKTMFGEDMSMNGINILHEMLQNRLVLKSIAYQIFDTVFLELFPEISDVVSGSKAVDSEEN
jgi:hypothetical protein